MPRQDRRWPSWYHFGGKWRLSGKLPPPLRDLPVIEPFARANYTAAPQALATWFVDPPYPGMSSNYGCPPHDRKEWLEWIETLRGLVIVTDGAPFPRASRREYVSGGSVR